MFSMNLLKYTCMPIHIPSGGKVKKLRENADFSTFWNKAYSLATKTLGFGVLWGSLFFKENHKDRGNHWILINVKKSSDYFQTVHF